MMALDRVCVPGVLYSCNEVVPAESEAPGHLAETFEGGPDMAESSPTAGVALISHDGLALRRPEFVERTTCSLCGAPIVIGNTSVSRGLRLSAVPVSRRWLLVQRRDGLFSSCGSVGTGYTLHHCPGRDEARDETVQRIDSAREAKAAKLADALRRTGVTSGQVATFGDAQWAMAEQIAGVRASSSTTRALACAVLAKLQGGVA